LKFWGKNEYIYDLAYSKENLITPQQYDLFEGEVNLRIEARHYSKDDEKPHNVTKTIVFTSICEKK